jgi:hypothetical protein
LGGEKRNVAGSICGLRTTLAKRSIVVWPKWSTSSIGLDAAGAHAEADALEAGLLLARLRLQPFQAVLLADFLQVEGFAMSEAPASSAAGVEPITRATLRTVTWFRSGVMDPDALAVADDGLLRLGVDPAEAARAQEREAAIGVLHQLAGLVVDLLRELAARRLRGAHVALETLQTCRA